MKLVIRYGNPNFIIFQFQFIDPKILCELLYL